jgi:hypothetical protein
VTLRLPVTSPPPFIVKVGMAGPTSSTVVVLSSNNRRYQASLINNPPSWSSGGSAHDINDSCAKLNDQWGSTGWPAGATPGLDGIPQRVIDVTPSCAVRQDGAVMCWTTDPRFSRLMSVPCEL